MPWQPPQSQCRHLGPGGVSTLPGLSRGRLPLTPLSFSRRLLPSMCSSAFVGSALVWCLKLTFLFSACALIAGGPQRPAVCMLGDGDTLGRDMPLIRPMRQPWPRPRQPCVQLAGGWWGLCSMRTYLSVLHLVPGRCIQGRPGGSTHFLCLSVHTSAGISVLRVHCKPVCSAHPRLPSQHLWVPELLVPKLPLSACS